MGMVIENDRIVSITTALELHGFKKINQHSWRAECGTNEPCVVTVTITPYEYAYTEPMSWITTKAIAKTKNIS